MKTIIVFQAFLPLPDFPAEEELTSKPRRKMNVKLMKCTTHRDAEIDREVPVMVSIPSQPAPFFQGAEKGDAGISIDQIKDIGCAIIQKAVEELRDIAKKRFWQSASTRVTKSFKQTRQRFSEQEDALSDLKAFFYGEGLVDVIDCYCLEQLTPETILDGVDPIFEELAQEVAA